MRIIFTIVLTKMNIKNKIKIILTVNIANHVSKLITDIIRNVTIISDNAKLSKYVYRGYR